METLGINYEDFRAIFTLNPKNWLYLDKALEDRYLSWVERFPLGSSERDWATNLAQDFLQLRVQLHQEQQKEKIQC